MTTSPADRLERAALDEAKEQLANGWTASEVAAVLNDAQRVLDDLRANEATS